MREGCTFDRRLQTSVPFDEWVYYGVEDVFIGDRKETASQHQESGLQTLDLPK